MFKLCSPILSKKNKKVVVNNVVTEEDFWNAIADLNWCDRSDGSMTVQNVCLSNPINDFAIKYKDNLDKIITEILPNFEDKKALISHIIAKGEQFYNFIIADPTLIHYLIPYEYQVCRHYNLSI